MSEQDRKRWNARYQKRDDVTAAPSEYLVSLDALLPRRGRALDVAAGTGRNSIWLARRGLDVTAVDISDVGLAVAMSQASRCGVTLTTHICDLDTQELPAGPWDLIVDFNFLYRPLFRQFARELADGGLLVFAQPTTSNLERHPKPGRKFLLDDEELPALISEQGDLLIIDYREGWQDNGRHEARIVARRRPR